MNESRRKHEEPPRAEATDRFAVVPLSCVEDPTLTHAEFRLVVALIAHDLPDSRNGGKRKGFVSVGRTRLSAIMGTSDERHISRMLEVLEKKGWLRREFRPGRTTLIHLPKSPAFDSTLGAEDQGCSPPRVLTTKGVEGQGSLGAEDQGKIRNKKRITISHPKDAQPPAPREQAPKRKETTDPRVGVLLAAFCDRYREALGADYVPSFGRDNRLFKELLALCDQSKAENCIDLFFSDPDPWLQEAGRRTVPVLKARMNRYLEQLAKGNGSNGRPEPERTPGLGDVTGLSREQILARMEAGAC